MNEYVALAECSPNHGVQSASEFVSGFQPPEYLVDDTIQKANLYSLTGQTGHGKTSIAVEIGRCIASGKPLGSRKVEQGAVLYCVGENADDLRGRTIAAAQVRECDLDQLPFYVKEGPFDLVGEHKQIEEWARSIGGVSLVIVDTLAAFYRGEDENSNVEMGNFARTHLRPLTALPGSPAVLVPSHPTKNATRDKLVPRGGGAFLAEVDGNLCVWSDAEGTAELAWSGKLRGPGFEPLAFRLETTRTDALVDSKGRQIPTVLATAMSDQEMESQLRRQRSDEDHVLDAMREFPNGSMREWCEFLNWKRPNGEPQKSKIEHHLHMLERDHLVCKYRGKWKLTQDGRKEAGK